MADFCKQCSIEMFGKDHRELAHDNDPPLESEHGYVDLCENCGWTLVDNDGACIYPYCPIHGEKEK